MLFVNIEPSVMQVVLIMDNNYSLSLVLTQLCLVLTQNIDKKNHFIYYT